MRSGEARSNDEEDGAAGSIAVVRVESSPSDPSAPSRPWERWSLRLANPAGVLLALPALVAMVGLVLTISSYERLKDLGKQDALERFAERAEHAELSIRSTISQADALLDRSCELAREHSSRAALEPFARSLRDLSLGRRGLKWLSVSFPDGTFQGVFVEGEVLRFKHSRVVAPQQTITLQYDFAPGGLQQQAGEDGLFYDPRERDFYREAVASKTRIWTQPYPFYPDFRSGISRVEAVYDAAGRLHAVVTADYEIAELSGVLRGDSQDSRLEVVFSGNGALLALSGMSARSARVTRDRAVTFADLNDPVLGAFFATRTGRSGAREFETAEGTFVAVERPLASPAGLGWRLAAISAEAALSEAARSHARAGLISSTSFVLAAVLVSAALAFGVRRLRAARSKAELRAETAIERARALGSYQLEQRIGRGGMGEVWRARHRLLARPAAIKLIRTERLGPGRERLEARFAQEARVLSSLRSPNTVQVFDFGRTTDGRLFLVMELLEGLTLDRVLKLEPCLPAARVIEILIGACRSLAEAHAAGLVHRDVKPANLFLCYDGDGVERVKVIDFGLVKAPAAGGPLLSQDGSISGTPDYMAPEQARSAPVDGRTDLYALGCTAFHLLTGQPVFSAPSDVATLLAHQLEPPPSLSKIVNQYLPAELETLVLRCLAKQPECRPSSAASLGRALAAIRLPDEHQLSAQTLRQWWEHVSATNAAPMSSAEPRVQAEPA
jgi:hypothetical protein